jgi:hypothetical protein
VKLIRLENGENYPEIKMVLLILKALIEISMEIIKLTMMLMELLL